MVLGKYVDEYDVRIIFENDFKILDKAERIPVLTRTIMLYVKMNNMIDRRLYYIIRRLGAELIKVSSEQMHIKIL